MNDDMKTNRSLLPLPVREEETEEENAPAGIIRVHESVIVSIVRKAACSVEGVIRFAGNSFVNNLADIVGNHKIFDRAISIEMGDASVKVEVRLVLKFGCSIPETASAVQQAVANEITRITGMDVDSVNIIVADLEEEEKPEVEQEENDSEDDPDDETEKIVMEREISPARLTAAAPANFETDPRSGK